MNFYKLLSTFVGHFCPPGSGSGFRIRIRIHRPDWIRIQSGSTTLKKEKNCYSVTEPNTDLCWFEEFVLTLAILSWWIASSTSSPILSQSCQRRRILPFIQQWYRCIQQLINPALIHNYCIMWKMRIQETNVVDPDPDPGFWWPKIEKKYIW